MCLILTIPICFLAAEMRKSLCNEPINDIISFPNYKHEYLIQIDQTKLKDRFVNRVFPTLHGGSLEFTRTVPFNLFLKINKS